MKFNLQTKRDLRYGCLVIPLVIIAMIAILGICLLATPGARLI